MGASHNKLSRRNEGKKITALLFITFTLMACTPIHDESSPAETNTSLVAPTLTEANSQSIKTPEIKHDKLPSTSRKTEEINVYSFLLNQDPEGYISNSPIIFIVKETRDRVLENTFNEFATIDKETISDYEKINKQKPILELSLSLNRPYEILSEDEMYKRALENREWFKTYTITMFSGIGFNSTFEQAVVYMEHDCGGECAIGSLYFLLRTENGWKIEDSIRLWIS